MVGRVLIADGDAKVRGLVRELIVSRWGLEVLEAGEGAQTIKMLGEGDFRLLILDMGLPGLDGSEVLRTIRGSGDATPVILTAEITYMSAVTKLMRYNISDFLLKPIDEIEMSKKIAKAIPEDDAQPAAPDDAQVGAAPAGEPAPQPALPKIVIPARVLIVVDDKNIRNEIVKLFKEQQLDPRAEREISRALQVIETDERLAAMVVDLDVDGVDALDFLQQAIFMRSSLSIIPILNPALVRRARPQLTALGVKKIFHKPVVPEELHARVLEHLGEHLYDDQIIGFLSEQLPKILCDIKEDVVPQPPFLRVSPQMMGAVTAMVEVTGSGLWGKLSVSGPGLLFVRLLKSWLGSGAKTSEEVWDALGELSSRLGSAVRGHYMSRGLESEMSLPLVVQGQNVQLRLISNNPSLVIPYSLGTFNEPLFVEWTLAAKQADKAVADEQVEEGELEFF